jgi:hypothetical protein
VRQVVPARRGRHHLIQQRQTEVLEVHHFELGVAPLGREVADPLGHGLAVASRARAADDDRYLDHVFVLSFCSRSVVQRAGAPGPSVRHRAEVVVVPGLQARLLGHRAAVGRPELAALGTPALRPALR